ncbi:hypothetical protein IFM89_028223 [Coptis chinensis]|uniref:Uncharacterized protein n=1 Tax=Coptis chinensis TaxID=261450 RepID=A0A835IMN5_9MAGN|nr:hypothetical protein IFM89_028223 [Coptis chinensis]
MADYSYTNGGYMSQERSARGPRSDGWESKYGSETHSPGWGKPGFATNGVAHQDHVCKPIIVDAQGRKRPIISFGPSVDHQLNAIVRKTETIIEQLHVPQATYGNGSPTKVGQMKDYGALNHGWNRPLNPSHDRPPKVDEFVTKVQSEASRANNTNPANSRYWGQSGNSYSYSEPNSYSGNYENGSSRWNKTSGNNVRDPYFGGYQGKNHMERDTNEEPTIITSGGWARPSHLGWAIPPNKDGSLTNPTNNIGAAIDYLKDATVHTAVNTPAKPWFTVPTPTVATIDSREARRRYGSVSESPQAVNRESTYSSAIDSREAVRRYGGQIM